MLIFKSERIRPQGRDARTPWKPAGHIGTSERPQSTGVRRQGDETVSDAPGALVESFAFPTGMAADLTLIEDQRQSVGQQPDYGEHHQRGSLVDGGMFEMTVGGDGLKHFRVDSLAATAESQFGQITSASDPRILQIALKLYF